MAGDAEKMVKAIDKVGQMRYNKDKEAQGDVGAEVNVRGNGADAIGVRWQLVQDVEAHMMILVIFHIMVWLMLVKLISAL